MLHGKELNKLEIVEEKMPADFESILFVDEGIEWVKIKVFNDHNLAVGLNRNRNVKTGQINAAVYRMNTGGFKGFFDLIEVLPGTKRSFKKRDMKIAKWYYRELCEAFKDGILMSNESRTMSHKEWRD
jgi:hypothetical protein